MALTVHPPVFCNTLSELVQESIGNHMYKAAVFYADKLCAVRGAPEDYYLLAQAHFVSKQYRRCLQLLRREAGLIDKDIRFCYLAAKCLAAEGEWDECLTLLGDGDDEDHTSVLRRIHSLGPDAKIHAAVFLLRGKVYDALENRTKAIQWYKTALSVDPYCYEAFDALVGQHMLPAEAESQLIESLHFHPEDQWLKLLYEAKCSKYWQQDRADKMLDELEGISSHQQQTPPLQPSVKQNEPSSRMADTSHAVSSTAEAKPRSAMETDKDKPAGSSKSRSSKAVIDTLTPSPSAPYAEPQQEQHDVPAELTNQLARVSLRGSVDVVTCRAEWHYHRGAYRECFALTTSLLQQDPYATECLPIHLASALQLRKKNELFLRAHKLVQAYPTDALSWFAVGCYYMCTQQYDAARRYFGKATSMRTKFVPAWIGFGNAFAAQDESDQALAAYRTAARLFPGLHQPVLGMGMEYMRMSNVHLAEQMFLLANHMCNSDPLVHNELGVLFYYRGEYDAAASWLRSALRCIPSGQLTPDWEPTVVNLGHVLRKQRHYAEAIKMFEQALGLRPGMASTYAALGFTHHLAGSLQAAIENYHRALAIRADDMFVVSMLNEALQLLSTCAIDNVVTM